MLNLDKEFGKLKEGIYFPGHVESQRTALVREVDERLASLTLENLSRISTKLIGASIVEGVLGAVNVWSGDERGWEYLQQCLASLGCHCRLTQGLFLHGGFQTVRNVG